jgi:hypothetical protein
MSTLSKLILTTVVGAVASVVSVCIPLLSAVCGKRQEEGLPKFGMSHLSGADGG